MLIQRGPTLVAAFGALLACQRGDDPSDSAAGGSAGGTTSTASAAADAATASGFGSSTDASGTDTGHAASGTSGEGTSDASSGDASSSGGPPGGAPACDAGGQDAGSNGAEAPFGEAVVGLCRRALGCPSTWTLAPPPEGYKFKGTPNHKLLWRVWYYGWSRLMGTPDQVSESKDMLLDFFAVQVEGGHQAIGGANEVLTSSHYQIWANGMTCARLLAVYHDDPELLGATGRWWRGEKALHDVLQRGGSIDAPGARFKDGQQGPNQLRDVIYAMIRGEPLSGNPGKPNSAWWSDYYNVAAWTLRELQRLGDDLGGAADAGPADLPALRDPLEVYTQGDDYVFVFPVMRGALEPLFWTARIGGQVQYAPYVAGTPVDNPFPPPDLPGAALTTIPGSP